MRELIERLGEATGPDRELDADIDHRMMGWHYNRLTPSTPPYTASLDAAVALAERVLPDGDFAWSVQQDYGGFYGAHINVFPRQYGGPVNINTTAESIPLALCIAILKAVALLRAKEQETR